MHFACFFFGYFCKLFRHAYLLGRRIYVRISIFRTRKTNSGCVEMSFVHIITNHEISKAQATPNMHNTRERDRDIGTMAPWINRLYSAYTISDTQKCIPYWGRTQFSIICAFCVVLWGCRSLFSVYFQQLCYIIDKTNESNAWRARQQ